MAIGQSFNSRVYLGWNAVMNKRVTVSGKKAIREARIELELSRVIHDNQIISTAVSSHISYFDHS